HLYLTVTQEYATVRCDSHRSTPPILPYATLFRSFLRSFAQERSASPFLSSVCALFACLPGVAPSASQPILKHHFNFCAQSFTIRRSRNSNSKYFRIRTCRNSLL